MDYEPEVVTIDRVFTVEQVSIFLQENQGVREGLADFLADKLVDMIIDQTAYEESDF